MSFMSIAPRPQMQPSASLGRERVVAPVRRVGRDDVQVAVDQQGGPAPVLALDSGDHAGALGVRLQDRRLQAHLGQLRGDVLGGLALTGARVVARVGGVDPDQVAADADDLVLRGHLVRCHPPIVALVRGLGAAALRPGAREDSLACATRLRAFGLLR